MYAPRYEQRNAAITENWKPRGVFFFLYSGGDLSLDLWTKPPFPKPLKSPPLCFVCMQNRFTFSLHFISPRAISLWAVSLVDWIAVLGE